jgi:L-threonylcarbamoyladenylate synthase
MISKDINQAAQILTSGGIIGFPTETVYGLAGDIFSEKAIADIYRIKQRPRFNPLIVHLKSGADLDTVATDIPQKARELAVAFWPGPLTMVLKKQAHIPDRISSGKSTVAVRVPNHPVALSLLQQIDFPLAAPSANPFGSISPTTAAHVEDYFGDQIPMVLDGGACQKGIESTIIGFEGNEPIVYRLGSVSIEEIEAVCGPIEVRNHNETAPEAPGMLAKHYSPSTKLILSDDLPLSIAAHPDKRIGVLSFSEVLDLPSIVKLEILSAKADLAEAASHLYAAMHRLDHADIDLIIAEKLPDTGLGKSINDRLKRAATQ